VLFFSSRGMVYRMKVWRLPAATPQSTGKALVNLLPLAQGETITSILPLPEDESTWGELELMFATRSGNVRRNSLADFRSILRAGKKAMRLEEGDSIVGVAVASPDEDVLLTTARGQCIRFQIEEGVRLFKGRDSDGVRGIRLGEGDTVISMAILRHTEVETGERDVYLSQSLAVRRAQAGEGADAADAAEPEVDTDAEADAAVEGASLSPARYAELAAHEQFVLTVSEKGYGKRTSSYAFRISGRGGKGITAMAVNERNGPLVASFAVEENDQIMLVTDGGKLIRCPVDGIRITGRSVQGVRILKTEEDEKVVSVERIPEDGNGNGGAENGDAEA
jgi:DNA gyrase subunit A